MPLYALADMTPNDDNLYQIINLENRGSAPPPLNGFRWLAQNEFAEGEQVGIGRYWTGTLPARFVDKPQPEVPGDGPATQTEALEAARAKLQEGLDLIAAALALG